MDAVQDTKAHASRQSHGPMAPSLPQNLDQIISKATDRKDSCPCAEFSIFFHRLQCLAPNYFKLTNSLGKISVLYSGLVVKYR